jgi:hypothetical protein
MLNALCRFPRLNSEGSRTFCTFLSKYAFSFPNSSTGFGIARQSFLPVPGDTVIAAP